MILKNMANLIYHNLKLILEIILGLEAKVFLQCDEVEKNWI